MTAVTEPQPRIATLDIVRGIAVMGILAMNIVAFAMPFQAYMNPVALGSAGALDLASWVFSFVLVDGKMRGLFSFLFGASMLLVIEKAEAKGENAARIHFRRMGWLLVFGLLHLYLIWFGDILTGYALVGMAAWFFHASSTRALIRWAIALLALQLLILATMTLATFSLSAAAAAPGASAETIAQWHAMAASFDVLSGAALTQKLAIYSGGYGGILADRVALNAFTPISALFLFGWETLAYFLLGMAALRTGFLRGDWSAAAYRRTALIGFGIGLPAYALLAALLIRDGFSVPMVFALAMAATVPFRPLMVAAIAATIILATRGRGPLVARVAAAGRAAFTNYLGTSILMTTLFYGYGLGQYGQLSRAELWLVVLPMWGLMLLWSKPWLDRFEYGPMEWLWRSLSRGGRQRMRKRAAVA